MKTVMTRLKDILTSTLKSSILFLQNLSTYSGRQDSDFFNILDCYVNLPEESLAEENPLNFENISEKQRHDPKLRTLKQKLPNQ